MRKIFLLIIISACSANAFSQSKTTEALQLKYKDSFAAFFYHNTLRMLNQKEDPEFDALIKDIEKVKFLMIDKDSLTFRYRNVVADYKKELFDEVMTSRHAGKNFDVFVREEDGRTKGMLVLINDSKTLYVLDILGSIALNKVTKLYSMLEESSDIGRKIKAFGKDKGEND